jgi:hypothetical protein
MRWYRLARSAAASLARLTQRADTDPDASSSLDSRANSFSESSGSGCTTIVLRPGGGDDGGDGGTGGDAVAIGAVEATGSDTGRVGRNGGDDGGGGGEEAGSFAGCPWAVRAT